MDFDDSDIHYFGKVSKEKDNFKYLRIARRAKEVNTKTLDVAMKWKELQNRWSLRVLNKHLMYLPDCGNMGKIFQGLDKNKTTYYAVKVMDSKQYN